MKVIPLQSGSKGNCYFVESGETKLLIDAGISMRQATLRMQSHNRDIQDATGLFITHDHSDHCRYVSDFGKRLNIPVHLTQKTYNVLSSPYRKSKKLNSSVQVRCFKAGETLQVGELKLHSIPTPHDAADGVAYILENELHRVGVLTDLGHAFAGLRDVLQSLDAVIIESNYDESLLNSSPYPEFLKQRIRGDGGHLSNEDSAKLLHHYGSPHLQWACLCHLSDENNCPDTAIRTHQNWLGEDFPLHVAKRHQVSNVLEVE